MTKGGYSGTLGAQSALTLLTAQVCVRHGAELLLGLSEG